MPRHEAEAADADERAAPRAEAAAPLFSPSAADALMR